MAKWSRKGVPHKGWTCVEVIDIGDGADSLDDDDYETCDMCGNERVRYVHVMSHPDYPEYLHVGCDCAEKMTEDYVNPRCREKAVRNHTRRKQNFQKKKWKFNPNKGSYTKKHRGEHITIMKSRYGNWGVFFLGQVFWKYEGRKLLTFDEAASAAFAVFDAAMT